MLLHVHRQGRASKKQLQVTVRNAEFLRFTSPRKNKEYSFRCTTRCQGTSFYSVLPLTCNRLRDTIPCNIPLCLPLHLMSAPGPGGTAVAQWLRRCATNRKVTGSIPAGVIVILHWHKILPIILWHWSRLSLYQKWVPGPFPGGKGGRCVRLTTLPRSCAVVMKSGNLNFLEPSGQLQACNGYALPFTRLKGEQSILTRLLVGWLKKPGSIPDGVTEFVFCWSDLDPT